MGMIKMEEILKIPKSEMNTKQAKEEKMKEEENKLPESNVPADIFWDLIYAAGKPQVLKYGIDFKVFNHLSMPISAEEVARRIDTKPEPTSRLLDMLAIMGMIEKADGRYVNTQVAEEFLVTGRPTYLGDFMQVSLDEYARMAAQIPMSLKNGIKSQTIPEEQWSGWSEMTIRVQLARWASKVLPLVADMPEFPRLKRMLDLAGNAGIYTVALVSHHPTLEGIVFDQPSVIETTREVISKYGLDDRIGVLTGDFTKDDIGNDYDLVRTSDTLSFFPDKKKLENICKKVYESMNPGGVFISQQQMVISKNRIWPPDTAWLSHIMALAGSDCTLYETDISEAMLKAGFKSVESRYVKYNSGTNRVDIARK
jgi:ubiquinone/menaquinone biosynthesis C-methylase UbiE